MGGTLNRKRFLLGAAILCLAAGSAAAATPVSIPAEDLKAALDDYIRQTGIQLIYNTDDLAGTTSHAVENLPADQALLALLAGTGLTLERDASGASVIFNSHRGGDTDASESVVVTGSRIPRDDGSVTPPVIPVLASQILKTTPSSLPDALNKLPIFAPAQTSNSSAAGANGKGTRPPGNFMDLRGLGPIRTLILEDGHRMPATWFDGTFDINTLPQMLVSRVDIVAGGASAVYGSDAMSGVVNFVLDHHLNGIKAVLQGGLSGYGDAPSYRAGLAAGQDLWGGRGHIEFSAELFDRDKARNQQSRPYGDRSVQIVGSGTTADPYVLVNNGRISNTAFGGLVTDGPFAGQQFLPGGQLAPFNPGIATSTTYIARGGDGGWLRDEDLGPSLLTDQAFTRFDYDLSSQTHAYIQASYAQSRSNLRNQNLVQTSGSNAITIYSGNAFLAPDYQAALTASGTPSFNLNRYDEDFGSRLTFTTQTGALAATAGISGKWRRTIAWDVYVTHGEGRTIQTSYNNINNQRFYAAADAVRDPANGQIVCRTSLTAPGLYPGCVPIDLFGDGTPSQAAENYISGTTWWVARNVMNDVAANMSADLFEGWAGPIKAAVGGEYRRQSLNETTSVLDNNFDPTSLRAVLAPGTLKWTKDIAAPASGANAVYEGNVEVEVPLLKDLPLVQRLSTNGAYRYTHYTTSGDANSWKLGLEWMVADGLSFRATKSRDIRAPTLFDLYQGVQLTLVGHQDLLTNSGGSVNVQTQGNPRLIPEIAHNTAVGAAYQPTWAPHLELSLDYYRLSINNAIGTINGASADVETMCNASGGSSPFCQYIVRPYPIGNTSLGNYPILLKTQKLNIASLWMEGMDAELRYTADLVEVDPDWDGTLSWRLFWSHQPMTKSQSVPGAVITNQAGTAQSPIDRITVMAGYGLGRFNIDLLERYQSGFHQSGTPTLIYAIGDVPAYLQTDIDMSWDFQMAGAPWTWFISVENLFGAKGGLYQTTGFTGNPGMNYPVGPGADIFGRYYTMGLRLNVE